ncbi:CsbD family protein [Cellulomonas sp. WB94]|uniref:CsbD family protein n=1 Tax=Cellulomonas sp. WB94 TaxID=2173174 RepID=UPI000D569902|nr:CsbD family protein [Cellulomonas sp. WB94]PVU83162.1 CsbD family protein [Cellulomonas sp. WB94]
MGLDDKIANAAEHAKGTAKEAVGDLTDNERLEAEGKLDQAKADAKKVQEDIKDAFKD